MKLSLLFLLILLPLVSAGDAHGPHAINENVTLFLNCNDCTSGTITKIIHPNSSIILTGLTMVQDGTDWSYSLEGSYVNALGIYEWCFAVTDGSEVVTGCIPEEVTISGEDVGMFNLIIDIFMICLIIFSLIIAMKHLGNKDFEAMDRAIIEKHEGATYFKTFGRTFVYGLMKNSFLWFYLAGWLLLFFVNEVMLFFGTVELYNYILLALDIYSIGFLIVIVFFIGMVIKHFDYIKEIIEDINLGVEE